MDLRRQRESLVIGRVIGLFLALVVVATLLATPAPAQPRRDELALYDPAPGLRFEAVVAALLPGDTGRLDLHAWIRPSVLVFTRTPGDTSPTPYAASAEISLELVDSAGAVRYQRFIRRSIAASTSDATALPDDPITVSASATLPAGRYSATLEVTDPESRRRLTRRAEVRLSATAQADPRGGSLLFCSPDGAYLGGFIGVGAPAGVSLPVEASPAESVRAVLRLFRTRPGAADATPLALDSLVLLRTAEPIEPDTLAGGRYRAATSSAQTAALYPLPVVVDTLPLGAYRLDVTLRAGARTTLLSQPFTVFWPRMPRSLQSLRTAVAPLEYLLTSAEFKRLKDLDAPAQRAAFEAFWRAKNPNPRTPRNDVMGEFYRRVDRATTEFSTIRHPDGAMTDRGKYFILLGPPTSRQRILGTSAPPQEVWTWEGSNRSLIFIDEKRTGDYVLRTEQ